MSLCGPDGSIKPDADTGKSPFVIRLTAEGIERCWIDDACGGFCGVRLEKWMGLQKAHHAGIRREIALSYFLRSKDGWLPVGLLLREALALVSDEKEKAVLTAHHVRDGDGPAKRCAVWLRFKTSRGCPLILLKNVLALNASLRRKSNALPCH